MATGSADKGDQGKVYKAGSDGEGLGQPEAKTMASRNTLPAGSPVEEPEEQDTAVKGRMTYSGEELKDATLYTPGKGRRSVPVFIPTDSNPEAEQEAEVAAAEENDNVDPEGKGFTSDKPDARKT